MKKLKMQTDIGITFEEGCKLYIENCQQRNLRADTIRHYRQSYDQFFKYFDPDMPLTEFTEAKYKVELDLEYGATNSFGAEIKDDVTMYAYFTIDIESADVTFSGAELSAFDKWEFSK